MYELVQLKGNDVFKNSLVIADGTKNKHQNVKGLIKKYEGDLNDFRTLSVLNVESTGGRPEQFYQLNEVQATLLITLLKNSKVVVAFKKELVRQFYSMRKFSMQRQSVEWQSTRILGKLTRHTETGTLKQLVEYAKEKGSKNADKLYMTYSKLVNKMIGVNDRDNVTISQLNNLNLAENIILHCIQAGIAEGKHYKEIYQDSKRLLEMFKEIAFLEAINKAS